jgi:hypothetical protein
MDWDSRPKRLLTRFAALYGRHGSLPSNHTPLVSHHALAPINTYNIGCIEYLRRFGYSDYQVYLLLSCAPVQGHVAGIVDIPKYVPLFPYFP